ncbi:MAG: lytic transglycosylase domain-containing protein [Neisseria animaloris]|nr:lytic transglycosylase domain-containing protein [Neisseria animaloris]
MKMKTAALFLMTGMLCCSLANGNSRIEDLTEQYARMHHLDSNLVRAVMGVESEGNPNAVSNKDARGLMQVQPATARDMGVDPGLLYQPEYNLLAGTRYLRFLSDRYNGNLDLMLAGYNAGIGAVKKYGGVPPYDETVSYIEQVKARYQELVHAGQSDWQGDAPAPLASVVDKTRPIDFTDVAEILQATYEQPQALAVQAAQTDTREQIARAKFQQWLTGRPAQLPTTQAQTDIQLPSAVQPVKVTVKKQASPRYALPKNGKTVVAKRPAKSAPPVTASARKNAQPFVYSVGSDGALVAVSSYK